MLRNKVGWNVYVSLHWSHEKKAATQMHWRWQEYLPTHGRKKKIAEMMIHFHAYFFFNWTATFFLS